MSSSSSSSSQRIPSWLPSPPSFEAGFPTRGRPPPDRTILPTGPPDRPDSYYPLSYPTGAPAPDREGTPEDDHRLPELPVQVQGRRDEAGRPAEGIDALRKVRKRHRDRAPAASGVQSAPRQPQPGGSAAAPGGGAHARGAGDQARAHRGAPRRRRPRVRQRHRLREGRAPDGAHRAPPGQALLPRRDPGGGHRADLPDHEGAHDDRALGGGHQPRRSRGLALPRRPRDPRRERDPARPRLHERDLRRRRPHRAAPAREPDGVPHRQPRPHVYRDRRRGVAIAPPRDEGRARPLLLPLAVFVSLIAVSVPAQELSPPLPSPSTPPSRFEEVVVVHPCRR